MNNPKAESRKFLNEAYGHYHEAFDALFTLRIKQAEEAPAIGETSDETLRNAFRRVYTIETLQSLWNDLKRRYD